MLAETALNKLRSVLPTGLGCLAPAAAPGSAEAADDEQERVGMLSNLRRKFHELAMMVINNLTRS